jgi:hypothetical protein
MDELAGTDWRREGDAIIRDLQFDDFAAAMAHVNRVADLAEEADAQRGEGDAELAGREVARQLVELAQHELRAALAGGGVFLDPPTADPHERELRGDEQAVEQDQHEDGQQQQDGHRRSAGRARSAPLLRELSSSFIRGRRGEW